MLYTEYQSWHLIVSHAETGRYDRVYLFVQSLGWAFDGSQDEHYEKLRILPVDMSIHRTDTAQRRWINTRTLYPGISSVINQTRGSSYSYSYPLPALSLCCKL
jgi:hypothetical protein